MAYEQMAYLYDELMKDAPYDRWLTLTEMLFKRSGSKVRKVADLGCGTGQITTRLAESGYQMFGVDISIDMLSYAEQQASKKQLPIQWIQQDLLKLDGLTNLDAAVSYCDVINYITSLEELDIVFNKIADILKPGGLFIFDVHSLLHVQHNFANQTFAEVNDDNSYIWFCSEGDAVGEMHHDLTFFVGEEGKYTRFDEYHHQRTYSIDTYLRLLKKAGFEIQNIYSDFSLDPEKDHEEAERIFFFAEKGSGK